MIIPYKACNKESSGEVKAIYVGCAFFPLLCLSNYVYDLDEFLFMNKVFIHVY